MSESAMDEKAIFAADAVWHERIKAAPDWPTTQALMLTRHAWWSALMEWDDEDDTGAAMKRFLHWLRRTFRPLDDNNARDMRIW